MALPSAPPNNPVTVYNALVPPEGPKVVPVALDFTTDAVLLVDFTLPMAQRFITAIQSVYIRNWDNPSTLTIEIQGTSQTIDIPPYSDVMVACASPNRAKFTVSTTTGVIVPILFFNVPLPSFTTYQPGKETIAVTGTITIPTPLDVTIVDQPISVTQEAGFGVNPVNFVVMTAGVPVNAFFNTSAPGSYITNPNAAPGSLFVDEVNNADTVAPGANGTTIELVPGQTASFGAIQTQVSVNSINNDHSFTAVWKNF